VSLAIVDAVPVITAEQVELIKTTIAKEATDAELQLFFYDCKRQGVHPLDKLIHFTKRGGKYTPITSIDFMRQRAAQTNECAGIDDAVFSGEPKTPPFSATVTVWRLVQGQKCAFTSTARWSEYKPEQHDFLWQKMPHVMLGKVAEAAALRKGFPVQLAGLLETAELDQATAHPPPPEPRYISEAQRKVLFKISRDAGWTDQDLKAWCITQGIGSTTKIKTDEFDAVLMGLQRAVTK
jgi:phage recombination protein Bet